MRRGAAASARAKSRFPRADLPRKSAGSPHEPLQFRLAISLHGATDEVRNQIMPVNRKYPLKELVAACEQYQIEKGRMITLEYILIAGVNDSIAQAAPLAALAKRLFAKVNLIPYNKVEGLPWERPGRKSLRGISPRAGKTKGHRHLAPRKRP